MPIVAPIKAEGSIEDYYKHFLRENQECELTFNDVVDLFLDQKGGCYYSGIQLSFNPIGDGEDSNAVLHTIRPRHGFTKGNVRWLDRRIAGIKGNFSEKRFLKICFDVAKYNEDKNDIK